MKHMSFKVILACFGCILVIGGLGYYGTHSFIPVNSNFVFGLPANYYFKTVKNTAGQYAFASQNVKGGKVLPGQGNVSPIITLNKGELVSFHLINEEKNEKALKSSHNLNIDEFNVHTNTLGYFETDTVTFVADTAGTFEYYCNLHPEMHGTIIVQ